MKKLKKFNEILLEGEVNLGKEFEKKINKNSKPIEDEIKKRIGIKVKVNFKKGKIKYTNKHVLPSSYDFGIKFDDIIIDPKSIGLLQSFVEKIRLSSLNYSLGDLMKKGPTVSIEVGIRCKFKNGSTFKTEILEAQYIIDKNEWTFR